MSNHTNVRRAIIAAAVAGISSYAPATIWNGTGSGSDNWNAVGSWDAGIPDSTSTAVFPSAASGNQPSVNGVYQVKGITFDNTQQDWSIAVGSASVKQLNVGDGGITVTGGGSTLLGAQIVLGVQQTWSVAANTTLATSGSIGGTGTLIKTGDGLLTIAGNPLTDRPTGTTIINGGRLRMGSGMSLGGKTSGGFTFVVAEVNSGGVLEFSSTMNTTELQLNNGATLRSFGSAANFNYGGAGADAGQLISLDNDSTVYFDTATSTDVLKLSKPIAGGNVNTKAVIKGPGTVDLNSGLSGAGSFQGSWVVESGTLKVTELAALGTPGATNRPIEMKGGTMILIGANGGAASESSAANFGNALTVTGDSTIVIEKGAGAGRLSPRTIGTVAIGSQTLTIKPGTNITNGGVGTSQGGYATGPALLNTSAINFSGNSVLSVEDSLSAGIDFQVVATGLVETTAGSNFTKSGTGWLRVTGASTYTGTTTITGTGSKLTVANTAGLGSTSAISVGAGAALELMAGGTNIWTLKSDLSGSGAVTVSGGTGGGSNTLNLQGSNISPGASPGTLSVTGNVALALDPADSSLSQLTIEVDGGNGLSPAVAGTDFDLLAISGTLSGLANAKLVVDIDPLVDPASLAGETLTIATFANSASLGAFSPSNITFLNGWTGTVGYTTTSITISNIAVPEPATLGLLAMAAIGMGRRRRTA